MKFSLSSSLIALAALFAAGSAQATDYYVATTGSDSNAGTMAAPFATLQKGVNTAVAGDTVYIRGGTYNITTPATTGAGVNFTKSGTAQSPINYFAYQGELPVFDFTNMVHLDHRLHARVRRQRELPALQGARDPLRPDEHLLQQRRGGDRRRLRHLRAAEHAPQQRQRDLHRQQDGRRSPDPQLRRARQLRRDVIAGTGTERRRLRRPLPDGRRHHDHPGLPRLVELRRRLRSDQPGGPRHRRELLGDRQRVRHVRHLQPVDRGMATASRWGAAGPASGTWSRTTSPGRTRRPGSTPTIRRAGTLGTTTRRS